MRILILTLVSVLLVSLVFNCGNSKKAFAVSSVKTKIVAQLKGKVKPRQVTAAYQKYKLEMLEMVDKSTNTWLFSFDPNLIKSNKMLKIMKNSQFVSTAKFKE